MSSLLAALRQKQMEQEALVDFLSKEGADSDDGSTEDPILTEEETKEETVEDPEDIESDVEKEVGKDTKDAEDTTEAVDDLQCLYVGLQKAQARAGVTAIEAEMAQNLAIAAARRLKITLPETSVDMQSLQTSSQRAEYTALALDNVKFTIKNAWRKFVEHIKKIFAAVVNFIKRWLFSWGRIQARAKTLLEKAKEMTGNGIAQGGTIENQKIIAKIYKKGADVVKDIPQMLDVVGRIYIKLGALIQELDQPIDVTQEGAVAERLKKHKELVSQVNEELTKLPDSSPKPTEGDDSGKVKASPAKVELPKSIPLLPIVDCIAVCGGITKLAVTRASKMRDENKKLADIPKKVEHMLSSGVGNGSSPAQKEFVKNYPLFAHAYLVISGWSTSYASAALDYVEASLHGGKGITRDIPVGKGLGYKPEEKAKK